MDYILNGAGYGGVAQTLLNNNFDVNALRPWKSQDPTDHRSFQTITNNGQSETFVTNAPATLRKDEWIHLDEAVVEAAQTQMRVVSDIRSAGLTYSIPNGMGKTILETESQSDITDAEMSMDGINRASADRPQYNLLTLPLPITHKDFFFTAREIAVSRERGMPLDTTNAQLAARKVAEQTEKLTLGEASTYAFGGGTIYGLTNYTGRLTKTLTAPTSSNHDTTLNEILEMRSQAYAANHYGPYMLYASPAWDEFLDEDFSSSKGTNTFRERIRAIENIQDVRTAHFLSGTQLLLVQMTPDVVRMVVGMDVTTIQWPTEGGMMMNFKVMSIVVPQLRADYNGNTGIVHGSV